MEFTTLQILEALWITLLAGAATSLGILTTYFSSPGNKKFLSFSLGFSAGVMIFISFFRILDKVKQKMIHHYGEDTGNWYVIIGFFVGVVFIVFFERWIHHYKEKKIKNFHEGTPTHLKYLGYFTALAISIHNFPEGFATFAAYLEDPQVGVSVALAVAIHNIPIGIAISVPIYYATKQRKRAFWIASATGAVGPLGAILGYLFLMPYMNEISFAFMMAIVAGILVVVAIDELLPTARSYGDHHIAVYGMIVGMFAMALAIMSF
jgi:ZIP family zinc transporter